MEGGGIANLSDGAGRPSADAGPFTALRTFRDCAVDSRPHPNPPARSPESLPDATQPRPSTTHTPRTTGTQHCQVSAVRHLYIPSTGTRNGAAPCPASSANRTFDSHDYQPDTDPCGHQRGAPPTARNPVLNHGRVGSLPCQQDRLTFPLTHGPARNSAGTSALPWPCEGSRDAGGSSAERQG